MIEAVNYGDYHVIIGGSNRKRKKKKNNHNKSKKPKPTIKKVGKEALGFFISFLKALAWFFVKLFQLLGLALLSWLNRGKRKSSTTKKSAFKRVRGYSSLKRGLSERNNDFLTIDSPLLKEKSQEKDNEGFLKL